MPPSTTEKINLKFETDEGRKFHLNVDPNIKIGQLKREITLEEKIDAKQLRALMSEKDIDSLEYLPDEAILSTLNLGSQVISVYSMLISVRRCILFDVFCLISNRSEHSQSW